MHYQRGGRVGLIVAWVGLLGWALGQGASFQLAAAEPGMVDESFNPGIGIGTYNYANVRSFAEQADGKILFGGYFQTYDGSFQPCFGRALPDGKRDGGFNPVVDYIVECIAVQPDRKILIGGDFTKIGNTPRLRIARLNEDGTLDPTFDPGLGANWTVRSISLLEDGKLVVGGGFTSYHEATCRGIIRLNPNGSIDASFNVWVEPLASGLAKSGVDRVVVQVDGKLLVSGTFTAVNGIARTNLVRLHPGGSVDSEFDPGRGPMLYPRSIAVQADGRPILANEFDSVIRLNTDGSRDSTFNAGRGALAVGDNWINQLVVQRDGRIVVGGRFSTVDGFPRNNLARLNSDGTFDWSFHPGAGTANLEIKDGSVMAIYASRDDRLLVGGTFATVHGLPRRGIARLVGGSLDPGAPRIVTQPLGLAVRRYQPIEIRVDAASYETPTMQWRRDGMSIPGATNRVLRIPFAQFSDAGDYTVVLGNAAGETESLIAKVSVNAQATGPGSLDVSYYPMAGYQVNRVTVDANDRLLVATGGAVADLQRLSRDGTPDPDFNLGGLVNGVDGADVNAVAIRPDGNLVVGGFFYKFGGQLRNNLTTLSPDGGPSPFFLPNLGPEHSVYDIALDDNGKMVIVGGFWYVNGKERHGVARLHEDGSLDESFNVGTGGYERTRTVVRQPDGKFIIGGDFTSFNGSSTWRIARLKDDGSVDASFNTGTGANWSIYALALQPDGKLLVGGMFTNMSGVERFGLARLNTNGSVDASFVPQLSASAWALTLALQPDGRIIVGGNFVAGNPRRRNLVRLNADGTVDDSFAAGFTTDATVWSVALQSDGSVIIGGSFSMVDGYPRRGLARLNGDRPMTIEPRIRQLVHLSDGTVQLRFSHVPGADPSVVASADLIHWDALGHAREIEPGLFEFIDTGGLDSRFYRVQAE